MKDLQIPGLGLRVGGGSPAARATDAGQAGIEVQSPADLSSPRLRPLILIADDEPDIVLVTKTRIRLSGYDVAEAGDGEVAVEMIRALRPNLVLLDLKMPKLNGYQVCRAVKADPDLSGTLILVCSASSSLGVSLETHVVQMGADGYIRKPYDVKNLLAEITQLLARRKTAGA
jgi:CheY-like chemotaxis protein